MYFDKFYGMKMGNFEADVPAPLLVIFGLHLVIQAALSLP